MQLAVDILTVICLIFLVLSFINILWALINDNGKAFEYSWYTGGISAFILMMIFIFYPNIFFVILCAIVVIRAIYEFIWRTIAHIKDKKAKKDK